jgi:hypothetical protein
VVRKLFITKEKQ